VFLGLVAPGPATMTRAAQADPVPAAADPNPRNVRREGPVLPYLRTDARRGGAAPGARRAFADGEIVRWSVAPDLRARQVPMPPVRFTLDRRPREPVRDGGPGDATGGSVRWTATPRREELAAEIDGDRCVIATDALTVVLVIERGTLEAGDRRFGSLVRRARASLDALNDLFAASVHPYAPRGVEERFRIDDARVYDRAAGPASVVPDPQAFDLAWVLDEGAPADVKPPAVDGVQTIGGVPSADATAAPPWSVAWEHARGASACAQGASPGSRAMRRARGRCRGDSRGGCRCRPRSLATSARRARRGRRSANGRPWCSTNGGACSGPRPPTFPSTCGSASCAAGSRDA
jgi:hypothetical protein